MKTTKRSFRYLLSLLALCLLLAPVCAHTARAEQTVSIPASRISLISPPGIRYSAATVDDGVVSVTIDTAASDFSIAVSGACTGELKQQIAVTAPEGAASYKYLNGWYFNEAMMMDAFKNNPNLLPVQQDTGYCLLMPIGALNAQEGLFTPAPGEQYCALQWFDQNGSLLVTEQTILSCNYTSEARVAAELYTIGLDTAVPNASALPGVTSRMVDGVLVYTLPKGWTGESIRTNLPAPAGAVSYTLSDSVFKQERYTVENGFASHFLYTGPNAQPSYEACIAWYASSGACIGSGRFTIRSEVSGSPVVQPVPVSRLTVTDAPVGMDMVVSKTAGDVYCFVDDQATDWDQVVTFNEPVIIYDPSTGETYPLNESVNFGFRIAKPTGAAYVAYGPGSWENDAALAAAMENAPLEDVNTTIPGWSNQIVTIGDGQVTLNPIGGKEYYGATTYAVRWADKNGNTMLVEKVELFVEFATSRRTYPAAPALIPAASIRANATGESYATASVTDGHVTTIFTEPWPSLFTEVDAPAGAVTYSICYDYFDPDAEQYRLSEGSYVGNQLEGWSNGLTPSTTRQLICWYDKDGNLTGGGWYTASAAYRPEGGYPLFVLPSSLKTVARDSFYGADAQKVFLQKSCTAIEARAFANCPGLLEVHIPATVTSIADDAFDGCPFVIIYAPEGSAAAAYADEHGLAWFAE